MTYAEEPIAEKTEIERLHAAHARWKSATPNTNRERALMRLFERALAESERLQESLEAEREHSHKFMERATVALEALLEAEKRKLALGALLWRLYADGSPTMDGALVLEVENALVGIPRPS